MQIISTTFDYILYLLVIASFLSFAMVRSFLVERKLVQWKLNYWNPLDFFEKYITQTKKENGKIGIWFWIFIYSFCGILLLGLFELLIFLIELI